MFFLIILLGAFFGSLLFIFTFIAAKKTGMYYMAPLVTFFTAILVTVFGLIVIGGFEGMGYGLIGAGFLLVGIVGTIILPFKVRTIEKSQLKKKDKISLLILPLLFIGTIFLIIYVDSNFWIIDKGVMTYVEEDEQSISIENSYRVSTISEGKKAIYLSLGKEYLGKKIEVESVSEWGPTEITVKIVEGNHSNKVPYLKIGVDEINEPLLVETTDGVVIQSNMDQLLNKD